MIYLLLNHAQLRYYAYLAQLALDFASASIFAGFYSILGHIEHLTIFLLLLAKSQWLYAFPMVGRAL